MPPAMTAQITVESRAHIFGIRAGGRLHGSSLYLACVHWRLGGPGTGIGCIAQRGARSHMPTHKQHGNSLIAHPWTLGVGLSCFVIAVLAAAANRCSSQAAKAAPAPDGRGKRLFEGQCSRCHGMQGGGGTAPTSPATLQQAPDDETLFGVIVNGIPGAGMPKSSP